MGSKESSNWLQDLKDTTSVIQFAAGKLYGFRNDRRVVSNEIDNFILQSEAKLIRQFSHLLYLKLQNENESAAYGVDSFGSVDLWLTIVNLSESTVKALKFEVKAVEELLQYNDVDMEAFCNRCNIIGEDRRRLSTATRNLKAYTKRWLEDKREPKDEFSDNDLCWMSYDRSNFLQSPNSAQDNQNRRSVSESADSGASDSGLDSHLSQISLPTASPPPSPASFTNGTLGVNTVGQYNHPPKSPTSLYHWNANTIRGVTPPSTPFYTFGQKHGAATVAQAKKMSMLNGKAPTTPPPSLRWGTAFGFNAPTQQPPPSPGPHLLPRSRSHESNLPNRIIKSDQPTVSTPLVPTTTQFVLPLPLQHSMASSAETQSITDVTMSPPYGYQSPTGLDIGQSLQVPKSPRGAVRMVHNINHRFNRMWKPSTSMCHHCHKVVGLSGEKCVDCKIKVHPACKAFLAPTCGLTKQQLRLIYDYIVQNKDESGLPSPYTNEGTRRMDGTMSTSISYGVLSGDMPLSSSSSCTSSAPSTPAPIAGAQPSPGVPIIRHSKFSFSEVHELPNITVEEAKNELQGSQGSDHTVQGSLNGAGSEQTLSPDDNVNSFGSDDSTVGNQPFKWLRNDWPRSTIRGKSCSEWREWTVSSGTIRFMDEPLRRGRFGDVARAYWHQDVAVKWLKMDHVDEEKRLETFKSEVSIFRSTRHENLVLFLGWYTELPKLGIVMDWCRGPTLYTILHGRGERLDMNKIINIAIQISQGKKIIHKDLRTKNIFIENNRVVITDFGLFSVGRLVLTEKSKRGPYLHMPEHWLCYLAPEIMRALMKLNTDNVLEELPFTYATDVFAFGTVWYELITNEFPFKGQSSEAIIWQVGRGIKAVLNNVQAVKEVKDMLLQCWAFKALDRFDFNTILKAFDKMPRKRLARSPSHPVHVSRSAEAVF